MNTIPTIYPRCIHFGICGGCRLQDFSYEDQLKIKEQTIRDTLAPFLNSDVMFYPIIGSAPWQYRNKMEFTFSSDKAGAHYLGLIMRNGRGKVINITECHLVSDWFSIGLKAARKWWKNSGLDAFHPIRNTGSLRTLTLREGISSGDRLVMLTVSGNPDYALKSHHLNEFVQEMRTALEPLDPEKKLTIFLRIQQTAKGMATQFYEVLLYGPDSFRETLNVENRSLYFKISPSAFFQPNTKQAEQIYSRALQMVKIPEGSIVYDLYCGTATLGISMAHEAKEVIGIEISPESVVDARENIKLNKLENITIIEGDVGKILAERASKNHQRPDLIVVDPPRAGLDAKAIQYIIQLNAPQLLYISCNPTTQSANLQPLIESGYKLRAVQPIDQFPQTPHLENIVVLTR